MWHDVLFDTRLITGGAKVLTYAVLALTFWRFSRRSDWRAVCLALCINFVTGAILTTVRLATFFTADDAYATWAEIGGALITAVCAYSIVRSVWR
jgi:hypothetical protein